MIYIDLGGGGGGNAEKFVNFFPKSASFMRMRAQYFSPRSNLGKILVGGNRRTQRKPKTFKKALICH